MKRQVCSGVAGMSIAILGGGRDRGKAQDRVRAAGGPSPKANSVALSENPQMCGQDGNRQGVNVTLWRSGRKWQYFRLRGTNKQHEG